MYSRLELSFTASHGKSGKSFRYVLDLSDQGKSYIESLHRRITDTYAWGTLPGPGRNLTIQEQKVYGLGGEHQFDGSLIRYKWYYRLDISLDTMPVYFSGYPHMSHRLIQLKEHWPHWENAYLFGIDYMKTGKRRLKLYFPEKNHPRPLLLSDFYTFLLRLGYIVFPDEMTAVSSFLLNNSLELPPTAYSVGLAGNNPPSVKLEIIPEAFPHHVPLQEGIQKLAQLWHLDASVFQSSYTQMNRVNPLEREVQVEVVCIDFYPDGQRRITQYLRF
jgi:hypothetical protein